jgi:hypothetical protein
VSGLWKGVGVNECTIHSADLIKMRRAIKNSRQLTVDDLLADAGRYLLWFRSMKLMMAFFGILVGDTR